MRRGPDRPSPHLASSQNAARSPLPHGRRGERGCVCGASLRLTAGCHGNGGTRRRLCAGPAPAHQLAQAPKRPHSDSTICPVVEGALWAAWPQSQFTHLLLARCSKSGPFGGPPGGLKGGDCWPALTQVPRHKQCPGCPGPAWRKLGRDNVSKLVGRGLWAWLTSTGRPRAHYFSLPGLHPPA